MSPQGSKKKSAPAPDIYTGLLFVAAAALITGCAFLVMELGRYDWMLPK